MQQQQAITKNGNSQVAANMNHGGHELFDVHEVLSCAIGALDQFMMYRQYAQDLELIRILDKQYQFMESQYNITVECFKTGQAPSEKTSTYLIDNVLEPVYGMQPSQPCKPVQTLSEIKDQNICDYMQGHIKSHASLLTKSALETTNPVVRRVLASQVQNFIEMSYELFMYQNQRGYYQVPQLNQADMQQILQAYAPASGAQMPAPNSGAVH